MQLQAHAWEKHSGFEFLLGLHAEPLKLTQQELRFQIATAINQTLRLGKGPADPPRHLQGQGWLLAGRLVVPDEGAQRIQGRHPGLRPGRSWHCPDSHKHQSSTPLELLQSPGTSL